MFTETDCTASAGTMLVDFIEFDCWLFHREMLGTAITSLPRNHLSLKQCMLAAFNYLLVTSEFLYVEYSLMMAMRELKLPMLKHS